MTKEVEKLKEFQRQIHICAKAHGFWNTQVDSNVGMKIALMHSELSEALESFRHPPELDKDCPMFSNAEIEFADCIIRILDFAEAEELKVIEAIIAKHKFNLKRPYKHNKKF